MLEALNLLKINATNGKENFCELSERELKAIKELAKREDKDKQILQQRIDKAIEYNTIISNSDYLYSQEEIANKNLSILQDEEVKYNV